MSFHYLNSWDIILNGFSLASDRLIDGFLSRDIFSLNSLTLMLILKLNSY